MITIEEISKSIGVKLIPCESSNVVAYGWTISDHIWVLFKGNKLYKYYCQPKEKFEELQRADSKGKWVNKNLVKSGCRYDSFVITK